MEDLLFLAQRIPYPPNKGDKIRSWHVLIHLAERYRVHLGCLYDDVGDARHIPVLKDICESLCCVPLRRIAGQRRMLGSLLTGEALTVGRFHDRSLARWVAEVQQRQQPSRTYVFSSAMAPYIMRHRQGVRILDMVDVDSEKWRAFAAVARWPMRQIYARERRHLFALERRAASAFDATLFATPAEANLFASLAPETTTRVVAMKNGVDLDYFDPGSAIANPYPRHVPVAVFTGAMDYLPNTDAVTRFARTILPLIRNRWPALEFWIVGRNPTSAVRRLARIENVVVTGEIADVRPYLAHASVVVAPLAIARGIQNKVIEAMAMAKPVVATPETGAVIDAVAGEEILIASSPSDFANAIDAVLSGCFASVGPRARERIARDYRWRFDLLDELFEEAADPVAIAGS
jgi:sugar transferase (PEP-CTERM/EpsH1 system associated)